jgi:hypothetical protein
MNVKTAQQYESELTSLFAFAGVSHPRALSEAAVNQWVSQARANNTRRGRLARACTFLRWCVRRGEADPALVEALQSRENPLRATPSVHGQVLLRANSEEASIMCLRKATGRQGAPVAPASVLGTRRGRSLRP